MQQREQDKRRYQPPRRLPYAPKFYWTISKAAFGISVVLWFFGQTGMWVAALGSAFFFAMGVNYIFIGFRAKDQREDEAALDDLVLGATHSEGKAKWATAMDAEAAGMTKETGLFLGAMNGRDLYYPGETHLLTMAPPGAGKGTSIVIPNLLTYRGSMIVTDPKGELFAITAHHREKTLGHQIIVLCPWASKLSLELGIHIPDHGFNPLSIIKVGPDIKDECELVSSLLLPSQGHMKPDDEFWVDGGQSMLTAFLLHLKSREDEFGPLTLPLLRQKLNQAPTELTAFIHGMSQNEDFNGWIKEYGGKLLGTAERAPRQFEGLLGSAQKALRIYDSGSALGDHVSKGEINFAALKDRPTTIYLIMPSDRSVTHAAWLNLVMSLGIELVGRDRSNRRVLFLLDEMANLGYMPNILRGMAQYRGQGVQIWSIIQQLSQLERLYGKAGSTQFIGTCEVVNIFGIWDPETAQFISQWLGQDTIRNLSYNVGSPDSPWEYGNVNYGTTDKGVALMRPEDVRTMSAREQLIFYRNVPPIRAEKVDYFTRPDWNHAADPNPYRR